MAKILLQRAQFNSSTHMVAHNCLYLQTQGIRHPHQTSTGTACMWHMDIHAVRIPLYTQNSKKNLKSITDAMVKVPLACAVAFSTQPHVQSRDLSSEPPEFSHQEIDSYKREEQK